jgi:hypothetical protein
MAAYHFSIREYVFIGSLHGASAAEAVLDSVWFIISVWKSFGKMPAKEKVAS